MGALVFGLTKNHTCVSLLTESNPTASKNRPNGPRPRAVRGRGTDYLETKGCGYHCVPSALRLPTSAPSAHPGTLAALVDGDGGDGGSDNRG